MTKTLNEDEQRRRREFFRRHWEHGVKFNALCGLHIVTWRPDLVEIRLPYSEQLSAHDGVFHGGVVAALVDTAGVGAVMAGHDYAKGSRSSTVSLALNYLSVAAGDLTARGHCVKRGGRIHFSEVVVLRGDGQPCARGQVAVSISGERAGVELAT
ncbi:PaaI family thioesterase [Mycobacterium sp. CVI_P3]|uniref:PaaI family thioesterase n=1 Tax=Mycobacterium pinniadriaticum TaxID=2994102 RepID=A0ABT3SMU0_9MYCO|nr:PaaI family thioesterase [Mycobacterium pinniadriaticum]MCX2934426.1 PaaI family thioesterase [Mycobacterium pinniadriaticum]MCX2940849.1 PaaI family thioesterase [Mycobacterium pinniadriaticum]